VCSFLLIGFYYERQSASNAANKAFITNRVGDAGFIIGLMILFAYVGTFDFEELFRRIRSPQEDSPGHMKLPGQIGRAEPSDEADPITGQRELKVTVDRGDGSEAIIFPREWSNPKHYHALGPRVAHSHGESEHGHGHDDEEAESTISVADNPKAGEYSSM